MSYLQKHPTYKWAIAIGDYLSLISGLAFSMFFLDYIVPNPPGLALESTSTIFICYLMFACVQIFFFQLLGLYHIQTITNIKLSFVLLSRRFSLSILAFFLLVSFLPIKFPPIQFFFILFIASIALLTALRKLCLLMIQHTSLMSDRVIIIGAGTKGQSMLSSLSNGIKVKKTVGFIDDNLPIGQRIDGVPVLGEIFESHLIACRNKVDFFIMAIDNISHDHFFRILKYFNENNLTIYITSNYLSVLQQNMQADTFNKVGLIRIGQPLQSGLLKISKRLFDILISLMGIIFLFPLFLYLSIMIKITSRGPVIYKQTRIGRAGKPFTFYKFRSMCVNSDTDSLRNEKVIGFIRGQNNSPGCNTKIVNYSHITGIGRIIRKTSLDELPQLFNVLRGDMSIVGPRPCLPLEWNEYESWQKQRLMFMPGCTGLWQVSGRSKVNFEESVIMDLYYNCNVSLWLDLKIILNTIPVMLFSKGGE